MMGLAAIMLGLALAGPAPTGSERVIDRAAWDGVEPRVYLVPSIQDGRPDGIKLYAIRRGSLLDRLGLVNGDTIQSINGYELASPDQALEAYAELRSASKLTVKILRRGTPVTMEYSIK